MKSEYSREEILSELRETNEQIEHTLTSSDVDELCSFSYTTCYNHFESFSQAKRMAGIDVLSAKDVTDEEYLEEIRRVAKKVERTPRAEDMSNHGQFSVQPYQSRWDSWSDAVKAAGLELENGQLHSVSSQELLDNLRDVASRLERTPTTSEIDELGRFSPSTYQKRFGTIANARAKAGLKRKIDRTERVEFECEWCGSTEKKIPSEAERRDYCSSTCANQAVGGITDEELIQSLKSLAKKLGRAPSSQEFDEKTKYWHGVIANRFGSYSQAIRDIGYEPIAPKDVSDEKLLQDLREIEEKAGRAPRIGDLKESGSVSTSMPYVTRFGSWADALEKAGIEPETTQRVKISKEELIGEYQRLADQLEKPPSYTEVQQNSKFSPTTYERAFGTFLEAKESAGFEPIATDNLPRGEDHYAWKEGKVQYYGKTWQKQRERALERDSYECKSCGVSAEEHKETIGVDLHVHHITPARDFDDHKERNKLSNLITLCAACHRTWESMPIQPEIAGGEA